MLTFLEDTFGASTAPPEHRLHQKAAQAMLKALLPESGTDIKGQMRSRQELLEASGYVKRPEDFDDLVRILDGELRLITPTDPKGSSSEARQTTPRGQYYQLSHDYAGALITGLAHPQAAGDAPRTSGTAAGGTVGVMECQAREPPPAGPPGMGELPADHAEEGLDRTRAPHDEARGAGSRTEGARTLALLSHCLLAGWEGYGRLRASALVESLQKVDTPDVPAIVEQLPRYRRWADPQLVRVGTMSTDDQRREHLHASLALLPVDAAQVDYLFDRLIKATPTELPVLRDALKTHRSTLTPKLWTVLESAKPGDASLLPSASALAIYDPDNAKWEAVGGKVAQSLVSVNSLCSRPWIEALRPYEAG